MIKYLPLVLAAQYLVLMICYLWIKDFGRALYWLSAAGITIATILMK